MHSVNYTLFFCSLDFAGTRVFLCSSEYVYSVPRSCAFENNGLCKIWRTNKGYYGKCENGQLTFESTQEIWKKMIINEV